MLEEIGDLYIGQKDGTAPTFMAAGRAAGDSGVSVVGARFSGGAHFGGTLKQNLIGFPMSRTRFHCRFADRSLLHMPPKGSVAVCPADIDFSTDASASVDVLLVLVHPSQLALAAMDEPSGQARLMDRFRGDDRGLFDLARRLWLESATRYANGPLFWSELAVSFVNALLARHAADSPRPVPGTLDKAALARVKDYVTANLAEPIDVPTLAKVVGRSPFHFSRLFARTTSMTPHRYVVQLRLRRAAELMREGELGLAEIAADTGFADQSHLSRWVKRVHGVTPSRLTA